MRLAGAVWRLLVHEWRGPGHDTPYGMSHNVQSDRVRGRDDSEWSKTTVLPRTEFDELVVGQWLHVEQMDSGVWWMNVGGVTVWVKADRDGRPLRVDVYGPHDYAEPVDGCAYEATWSEP